MKLFKTVFILSLAIVSFSSSVAFGCVAEQVAGGQGAQIDQVPAKGQAQGAQGQVKTPDANQPH